MEQQTTQRGIKLIGWGLAGPHGDGMYNERDTFSSSGWSYDPRTWANNQTIPDGTPVIYTGHLLAERPALAWIAPMVDVRLDDNTISRCPDLGQSIVAQAIKATGTGFAPIIDCHEKAQAIAPAEPGPLDSISVAALVRWWRQRGATVGEYRGGAVIWPKDTPDDRLPPTWNREPWPVERTPRPPEPQAAELPL